MDAVLLPRVGSLIYEIKFTASIDITIPYRGRVFYFLIVDNLIGIP